MGKRGSTRRRYVLGHFRKSRKGREKELRQRRDVLIAKCSCEECRSITGAKSSIEEICDKYEAVLRMLTEHDKDKVADERNDQGSSESI